MHAGGQEFDPPWLHHYGEGERGELERKAGESERKGEGKEKKREGARENRRGVGKVKGAGKVKGETEEGERLYSNSMRFEAFDES